jgi:hypothetical protein
LFAWQVAQLGVARFGAWGWWQPAHAWWPLGAEAASLRWQLAHAAGGAFGAWTAAGWQLLQSLWPVPWLVAARSEWQRAHSVVFAIGFGPWAVWHVAHAAWPVPAVVRARSAWQRAQIAVVGRGLPSCATWQSRHGAVACAVVGWQLAHATAFAVAGSTDELACGGWQPVQVPVAVAGWRSCLAWLAWQLVQGRRVVVRRVAGRTLVVRPGGEHGATLVTRRARRSLRGGEVMRCMTAGARRMSRSARCCADPERRRLRRVAACTVPVGGEASLVHAMTVEAAAHARVLGLAVGVALGAGLRIQRRRPVRAMTARARLIRVRPDRVHGALWHGVTLQALRGRAVVLAEGVTVLTAWCRRPGMQRGHHGGMASCTQLDGRRRETSSTVAFRAG